MESQDISYLCCPPHFMNTETCQTAGGSVHDHVASTFQSKDWNTFPDSESRAQCPLWTGKMGGGAKREEDKKSPFSCKENTSHSQSQTHRVHSLYSDNTRSVDKLCGVTLWLCFQGKIIQTSKNLSFLICKMEIIRVSLSKGCSEA